MAAYDTYAAALAPYVTRTVNRVPNLSGAIQKMIEYNSKMNLGLTDEQIVAGIKAFGDNHNKNFGNASVSQASNYNAIAAESVMNALNLAGKDGGAFWNNAVKDAYPVTSDGKIPGMPPEGGSWATKVVRGMPDQNWDYDHGGMRSVSDPLEKAVNNWIQVPNILGFMTGYSKGDVVSGYTDQRPLTFADTQRKAVADTMRSFNEVLGLGLTDEQMATGINKFSGAQYQIYQQGYNVGSDPYNIARWSLWNALNDTGKTAVGDSLIEKTNAKQALTATQAEEIYNKANGWVNDTYTKIKIAEDKAKDEGGFFGHLKNMAPGVLTIASLFSGLGAFLGPAGGAAGVAAGTSSATVMGGIAESLGLGDAYASFSSVLDEGVKSIVDATGLTGDAAKALTTGLNSAVSSVPKTILTGGDFSDVLTNAATSGVTSGAASLAGNATAGLINGVPSGATDDQYTSVDTATNTDRFPLTGTVAGAAAGAVGGAVNAGLTGGDVGDAALIGGVAGGVSGGVGVDAGAGQTVGSIAGGVAGGLVNQALQDDPVAPPVPPAATDTATAGDTATTVEPNNYALDWGDNPSFASILGPISRPEHGSRGNYGSRLQDAGLIGRS